MYALKGFITHGQMAKNTPGQLALIGELSTLSATYAKEKGYYGDATAPQYLLTTFLSKLDDALVAAPNDAVPHVLGIAKHVLDKTISSPNEIFADELLNDLTSTYAATAEEFSCGEIVTDGRFFAPEWISWKSKVATLGENIIRIWFVDSAFRDQYDEFEITVVPPLDNLNDFFLTGGTVQAKLGLRDLVQTTDLMQTAKGGNPETIMRIYTYNYVDPLNASHLVPSNWGVLIYGAAGDNPDSIKDALIAYVLANSTHSRADWTPLLPEIFKRTEFILVPRWDRYAIENRTVEAGIYSPVSNLTESLAKALEVISEYPQAHINSHAEIFTHPYKALSVIAVGGPENIDNKWELTDVFPDYLNVPTTSTDWGRMVQTTRDWTLILDALIQAAEVAQEFTSVPLGMSKVLRGGILYVVKSYKNIHYLVATKASVAPPAPVVPEA